MLETPQRISNQDEDGNTASKIPLVLQPSKDLGVTDDNSQTLVKSMIELENESKQYEKKRRHGQKASSGKGEGLQSLKSKTKQRIIALFKGYKVRRVLKYDTEIIEYINDIKALQSSMENDKENGTEIRHNLRMKKHLFHHTLKSKIKLHKQSKRQTKSINVSQTTGNNISDADNPLFIDYGTMSEHKINTVLMRRYIKN